MCLLGMANGCASLRSRHDNEFILYGMVYDDNGQPAADVAMTFDGKQETKSDYNGRFYFVNVRLGTHALTATGKNLESIEREVYISREGEVLYLRMISVGGLYQSCLFALREKDWKNADLYIDRALAITPASPLLRYAKAVCLSAPSRPDRSWQEAEAILKRLLEDGYAESAVYLLLADISQYDRSDNQQAIAFLESYLRLEYDPDIDARLAALGSGGK